MAKLVHLKDWEEGDAPFCVDTVNTNINYKLTYNYAKVTCKKCKKKFEIWKVDVLNEFRQMVLDTHNHIPRDEFIQVMDEIFVQKVMDA